MKCETCINHCRLVISENGTHYLCRFSSRQVLACLTERNDKYVKEPVQKEDNND